MRPSLLAAAVPLALGLSFAVGSRPGATPSLEAEGADLLGKRLPDWGDLRFVEPPIHRKPADFKGHALVVRFWTSGCAFCSASAPVLADWADRYRDRGLIVLAIYHPKPPRAISDQTVRAYAKRLKIPGVLAVDEKWSALDRLWLRGHERAYTSATLLVDREGIVRAVHRGGFLSDDGSDEDRRQARAFEKALRLLMENDRI